MKLLSSPRIRRRLSYVGIVLVALGGIGLLIALDPSKNGAPQHFSRGRVQRVTQERQVPLPPADRQAIDEVLDRFVRAAIARRNPLSAWAVSTRHLRAGTTRRQWARGDVPAFPYPARGPHFHDWVLQYSYPNRVGLELGLRPRPGATVGAAAYELELRRLHGAWLVDSIYLRAIYPR